MSTVLDDYKVDFLREESIAETALAWRKEADNAFSAYFNIVDFVVRILTKKIKRAFKIQFFKADEGAKPAFVTFVPHRTLHIDEDVWRLAELGEPEARFVVAHEVGHLILHDHHAKSFSKNPADKITFAEDEYSAEWQANVFASYFLAPTHIILAFPSFSELKASCVINDSITESRHRALAPKCSVVVRDGALCTKCGNFTVTSDGACTICRR